MRTDDPVRDAMERDAEFERWLKTRPICAYCGEHIQDEKAVCIDGEWICDECLEDMRREINDY